MEENIEQVPGSVSGEENIIGEDKIHIEFVNEPLQNELETQPTENLEAKEVVSKKRFTHALSLDSVEESFVSKILDERIGAGKTKDWNHFLRQCVDFTINHGTYFSGNENKIIAALKSGNTQFFGLPENIEKQYLKNGFFEN